MKRRSSRSKAAAIAGATAAAAAAATVATAWLHFVRRRQLGVAATPEEIAADFPLDDRVERPNWVTDRAITIRALPEEIWPWLAQIGESPRGGFYSYVTIERLMKMKVVNSDRILPEFQAPRVGDPLDRSGGLKVQAVERNRHLVVGPDPSPDLAVTWALVLRPFGDGRTRLVSRCRANLPPGIRGLFWRVLLEAGQLAMERKMLVEIRRRAESGSQPVAPAMRPTSRRSRAANE